ncbi:MAG: GNAT family N-acetyltransferase [Thermoplasmata archaeon]
MSARPVPSPDWDPTVVRLEDSPSSALPAFGDLSDFFNPFLSHFVRAALHGGGEVWVSRSGPSLDGLLLYNEVERVGSIFTRNPSVAQVLFGLKEHVALFSDFPLAARTEVFQVFRTDQPGDVPAPRFAHPVRLARARDQPAILQLMKEMYGRIDANWLPVLPSEEEKCVVVEISDQIVGVGWVTVVNAQGRLHSLSVRPHYRRMGIGTDLWHARMLWAHRAGARQVLSEIGEQNVASRAIATAGGMQTVGRLFLSYRPGAAPTPRSD